MILATLVIAFSVVLLLAAVVATQRRAPPVACKACEHFGDPPGADAGSADAGSADAGSADAGGAEAGGAEAGGAEAGGADAADGEDVVPSWVDAKARVRGQVEDPSSIAMHAQDRRMMPSRERFDHQEPDRTVLAREYGMDYVPPEVWSVPQFRPPRCHHQRARCHECPSAISAPYATVREAASETSVGSILPKFDYSECGDGAN